MCMPRRAEISRPPPRTRNHLRQEQPIPVFYFGVGIAVKKRCEKDGVAYLNLETVARGLGFTEKKGDVDYVMWRRVDKYLEELHFGTSAERPDYIPENIFYRLAMKAKNETAEKFQVLIADKVILGVGLSAQNFK